MKKRAIYVLGVHSGHTATACLLRDGKIIACVSEERFNGIKNYIGFPKKSIKWCLKYAKIDISDVTRVVVPSSFGSPVYIAEGARQDPLVKLLTTIYAPMNVIRKLWGKVIFIYPQLRPLGTRSYEFLMNTVGKIILDKETQYIASYLKISKDKISHVGHHISHAAAGYYSSHLNREEALVLTLDAEGDNLCSTVSIFNNNHHKVLAKTTRESSLGWIYLYVTKYLGMKPGEHEYKVMGLAPYAKERDVLRLYKKISDIIEVDPNNPLTFRAKFNTQDTYEYLQDNLKGERFDNIAGAFQKLIEERICEWISNAIQSTGLTKIVCSGGVFMNVKANQQILNIKQLNDAYFMPSGGDESLVIGACYMGFLGLIDSEKISIEPLQNLYLGPEFSDIELGRFIKQNKLSKKFKIEKPVNIEKRVAKLLSQGEIVARVSGKMEWGARALGNRSILADPRDRDLVMVINEQMKNRDFWMPFAPTILDTSAGSYITTVKKNVKAHFMVLSFDSTKKGREQLKAAMHPYDFTLRPQILEEQANPKYYSIIKEFERLTGVGGVLNTSFNLHGLPVVLGPKEAIYAFENSGLEFLALGGYLISKA